MDKKMNQKNVIIGVADTTFSRVNMFPFVEKAIKDAMLQNYVNFNVTIERYTVPGVKDLPVACKNLFENHNAKIVIALGMVGGEKIDTLCAHEASTSIQQAMLLTGKHILEVFVHIQEVKQQGKINKKKLFMICRDRAYKHAWNAVALLKSKNELTPFAGHGRRQGSKHAGEIKIIKKRVH